MQSVHKSVLLKETIDGLNLNLNDEFVVVDSTFGGGGHSVEILSRFPNVKVIGIDQDKTAWKKAKDKFKGMEKRITFVNANFSELSSVVKDTKVDGIIFDLGLSSDQLENAVRGFTFLKDEPLLMTMKEDLKEEDLTAKEIVNTWEEKNLADIIFGYGEEKYARRIAKAIVEAREKEEIKTTFDLVKIIENAVPGAYRKGRIHCATRTFQALRIAVNDELRVLEKGLEGGFEILKNGGRMSTITFHSLEDRIVKRFYKKLQEEDKAILINKKPIIATNEEVKNNPRSRSAKLRILEKN